MAELTPAQIKDTLADLTRILLSQSQHLERIQDKVTHLGARLEAVIWDHRYNQHFETEFDATVFYNALHKKLHPEWDPVDRIPQDLKTEPKYRRTNDRPATFDPDQFQGETE